MRLSTSWMFQQSVNTMQAQQSALAATQNQVSTGKRVNVASDDPAGAGMIVNLQHIMAANTQYTANIDGANTRLSTGQSALTAATNVLNSVRAMAVQGINGTLAPSDRADMAAQLVQMRDQLVQLANTTDSNGDALFAGSSTTKVPFVQQADGTVTYDGNDTARMAAIGSGLRIQSGDAGSAIFMDVPAGNGSFTASAPDANSGTLIVGANSVSDPTAWAANAGNYTITFGAGDTWSATDGAGNPVLDGLGAPVGGTYRDGGSITFNGMTITLSGAPAVGDTVDVQAGGQQDIFATLQQMIGLLQGSGTDVQITNGLSRQLESLDQGLSSISNTQVAIGGRMNTLAQQKSTYSDLNVTYQGALADIQGADVYQAISNLSLQSAALQASQQTFAQTKSLSLFNYIK